jgi:GDP-4-dehydro-6-deoxy-D-mannose reductase
VAPNHRLLVTGGSGFVGRHLLSAVRERLSHWEISAWHHGGQPPDLPGVHWVGVDLSDQKAVKAGIDSASPTLVVHLAAASNVGGSFADPAGTWSVNLMGTLNLLEALRQKAQEATVILVSSSEVYGRSFKRGEPLGEDAPMQPLNPYAASKAATELLANTYDGQGLGIACVRPFNHIGPGQSDKFAVPAFARQLARIEAGLQAPRLEVGNLEARRDFLDVRDVVDAYLLLLRRLDETPSSMPTLNLCSGIPRRIGDVLTELMDLSGVEAELVTDPQRMRPSDIPLASGDAGRARELLGWVPRIPWRDTLESVLADWRARVHR